ncbi:hypothetical protein [Legionella quateirensis]|uniref:Uncharacterized protein n=1 Tax=Legionella quateirensis TaxID=45072 RepID=A0A378KRF9_9GAMM|nr:hypothetical protein [Legionella quateirensis]KTD54716.1 hypothetical protein Lqua_0223 [Legionella quateirensis]STY16896.1 Uncharacterised protein [Legionella quateirensis]
MHHLKLLLLAFFMLVFLPFYSYAANGVNNEPYLQMDKVCVTNGMNNLKLKYPNLSDEDIKYITVYGCFCAYKEALRSSLPSVASDFRNASDCTYYAVLRNSMRQQVDANSTKDMNGTLIENECLNGYPHDTTDDSANDDLASFCKCAAIPITKINSERRTMNLNEDQIYDKIIRVIKGCRYNF